MYFLCEKNNIVQKFSGKLHEFTALGNCTKAEKGAQF